MVVFLNGKFVDARKAAVSVFDHGFLYADGVYETLRTYGGFVWQIEEHLRRLRRSAEMIGIRLPWSGEKLAGWIRQTVKRNGFTESRIRITVTRGSNGFDFGPADKPTLCIQVQRLQVQPAKVYREGAAVVTFDAQRILPEAKTLNLLPMVLAQRSMKTKNADEALLVYSSAGGRGTVKEGTVTNFFMVRRGFLVTPAAGVLAGTTRDAVVKLARRLGIPVRMRDVKLAELYEADEVFLTNAPRGIIPVRSIDGEKIGKSCPGPLTKRLTGAFKAKILEFIASQATRRV